MSIKLIQVRLNSYNCKSEIEEEQALREITQEVVLAALGRTDEDVKFVLNLKLIPNRLQAIITSLDWKATAEDVRRIVRLIEQPSLDLWGKDLFLTQLKKLK